MVVLGTVVGVVGTGLVYATFRETRKTAKSAAAGVTEASRAADAAEKAVAVASATAERQLRAYVSRTAARIEGLPSMQSFSCEPRVVISFKNTGQTPAYGVRYIILCGVQEAGWNKFELPNEPYKVKPSIGLGGEETIVELVRYDNIMSSPAFLESGEVKFFVYGRLVYLDFLKKERQTPFRFYAPFADSIRDGDLIPCEDGNEPD